MSKHRTEVEVVMHQTQTKVVRERIEGFWVERVVKIIQQCSGSKEDKKWLIQLLTKGEEDR